MSEAEALWIRRGGGPGTMGLCLGLFMLAAGLSGVRFGHSRTQGPPEQQLVAVPAKLVSAECGPMKSNLRRAPLPGDAGRLSVRFEYAFDGRAYSGDQYQRQPGFSVGTLAACEQLVDGLRKTPSLQAWVDPAGPHFAVLSKQLADDGWLWTLSGFGAALAVFGGYRLLRGRRTPA